ncbi:hypothetical protein GGR58DRAFT_117270 [Xylaria digitata]|nr:hypothetical protein GGR58DRAFT_117270 [Xylaria digitata]
MYSVPRSSSLESWPPKRCHSVPLGAKENRIAGEKLLVSDERPVRSISLTLKGRDHDSGSWFAGEFTLEPLSEEPNGYIPSEADDYDSDDEDRRNGVPTTYSHNRCVPFRASMKQELEAEFRRLKLYADELSATLRSWEPSYKELRRAILGPFKLTWTASQWEEFFVLEDAFFTLQDELFTLQDKMQNVNAQMYLFLDYRNLPSSPDGFWSHNEDGSVWSTSGTTENRARDGQYPILEWNGVDYNSLE